MRELKFRAWHTRLKLMEDISDLYWFEENMVHHHGDSDHIILQCTGLKDSNGEDIYEGDIVHAVKPNSYLNGSYTVGWHDTKGRWYYTDQSRYKGLYQVGSGGNTTCTVIGNIFEGIK